MDCAEAVSSSLRQEEIARRKGKVCYDLGKAELLALSCETFSLKLTGRVVNISLFVHVINVRTSMNILAQCEFQKN